jgi:hypothetical protein
MKAIIDKLPNFDSVIKSSGFAVFVMFAMMSAMAYTLWSQYNRMNDRLTALEQEIVECYKENAVKSNVLIEKNTKVMEEVIFHLQNKK